MRARGVLVQSFSMQKKWVVGQELSSEKNILEMGRRGLH